MHQLNAAVQEIQTSKNNFIAGFFSANPNFLLKLWDRLLDQATSTLNIIHKSIINPNLSTNEQLLGIFNFNCKLFVPPERRILVLVRPENRATYYPHG